jgi:hypothetical protein
MSLQNSILNRSLFYFFTDRRNSNWRRDLITGGRQPEKRPGIGSKVVDVPVDHAEQRNDLCPFPTPAREMSFFTHLVAY